MLKAYKTRGTKRALRVTLISDYLDEEALEEYCRYFDCVSLTTDLYISIYLPTRYPIINIDEYFMYADLMGIDLFKDDQVHEDSFPMLVEILEIKYGIEYVDPER